MGVNPEESHEKRSFTFVQDDSKSHSEAECRRISCKKRSFGFHPQDDRVLKKKAAFTLAEVLITLGIIGIVAAMTLPMLIQDYRHKELETRFKKSYSILWNVHTRMVNDYDGVYNNFILSNLNSADASNILNLKYKQIEAFSKYFNGALLCDYTNAYILCSTGGRSVSYLTYDGKREAWFTGDAVTDKCIITPDGAAFFFGNITYRNARIYIDTNGPSKKPNRLGFDLFAFDIDTNDRIVPAQNVATGIKDDDGNSIQATNTCSLTNGSNPYNGFGCSKYALSDTNPDDASKNYWTSLPK